MPIIMLAIIRRYKKRNALSPLRIFKTLGYNTPTQRKTQRTLDFRPL